MDGQSSPCELLSRPCPPELDLSPSARFGVAICFLVAFATITVYLIGTAKRHRIPKVSSEEWAQIEARLVFRISANISRVFRSISELNGTISRDHCKSIVEILDESLDFSVYRIRAYYAEHGPEDEAVLDCIGKILRSGNQLRSYLSGTSFLLLFPPMFNRARNRTLEAVRRHDEFANLVKGFNAKLADSTQMLPVFEVGLF
jgi:hypothetical protein